MQVLVSGKSPTLDTQLSLVADVSGNLDISQPLNITYQWFKNEEALLSETFFVLYFLSLKTSHSGKYCCQVTITSPQLQDAVIVTSIDHTLNLQGKSCPTQGMYVCVHYADPKGSGGLPTKATPVCTIFTSGVCVLSLREVKY